MAMGANDLPWTWDQSAYWSCSGFKSVSRFQCTASCDLLRTSRCLPLCRQRDPKFDPTRGACRAPGAILRDVGGDHHESMPGIPEKRDEKLLRLEPLRGQFAIVARGSRSLARREINDL
jgi:hypothetical protein